MTKYMRIEDAKSSKVYIDLKDLIVDRLINLGYFSKEDVLTASGYMAVSDSIRWDYLRRMIEEEHHTELIPLSAKFFGKTLVVDGRRRRLGDLHGSQHRQLEIQFPEQMIATGYGQRTAGFAMADQRNGHFIVQLLQIKRGRVRGAVNALNRTVEIAARANIKKIDAPESLFLVEPSPASEP